MKQFWIIFFGLIFGVIIGLVFVVILFIFMVFGLFVFVFSSVENEVVFFVDGIVFELDLCVGCLDSLFSLFFVFVELFLVVDVVCMLECVEMDECVCGFFICVNEFGMLLVMAEEMCFVIENFQVFGCFVLIYVQGFEGMFVINYYVVVGLDEIWLQDMVSFILAGLVVEVIFLGGLFE